MKNAFEKSYAFGEDKMNRVKKLFPKTVEAVKGEHNHHSHHHHDNTGGNVNDEKQSEYHQSLKSDNQFNYSKFDEDDQDAALKRLIQKGVEMDPEFANRMLSTVEQYADIVRQRNIVATGIYAVPASTTSSERNPRAEHDRHWMDLFFDLIYVASAFQLGILLEDVLKYFQHGEYYDTLDGVVIFIATFAGTFHTWQQKLDFASRFSSSDLFHRIWDIVEACVVACVAVNIPSTVEEFKDYSTNALWMFAFFKVIHQCISIGRWIEIAILSRASFTVEHALSTSAGAVITGLAGPIAGKVASMAGTIILSPLNDTSASAIHRQARSTGYFFAFSQIIGLMCQITAFILAFFPEIDFKVVCSMWLISVVLENIFTLLRFMMPHPITCCSASELVPIDVKYVTHRVGEWTMLILGEGVLSMILVNAKSFWLHFATFIPGFVVLVMLQVMYYSTQPHHNEAHALYRDKYRGFFWFVSQPVLSGVIIVLDVSIKLVLKYQDKIPTDPKYQIFVWLLCVSLCLLLIMIMTLQLLHNGYYEEFYEFSKNSPFAAVMKFGLWIARIIGALLIVAIPAIPTLPAWAVMIICAVLTVAQVVMLVMMTLLNSSFNVSAIRRSIQRKHQTANPDLNKKPSQHQQQPPNDIERGISSEKSINSKGNENEPVQLQVSMKEINLGKESQQNSPTQRNEPIPKLQKQASENSLDLSVLMADPTNISNADIQRLFNVYGGERLQELILQQAESVIGRENLNTATTVARTAQTVATTAGRFAGIL